VSAMENLGLDDVWAKMTAHKTITTASKEWAAKRRAQQIRWMWSMVDDRLAARLRNAPSVKALIPTLEAELAEGKITATIGAERIFKAFSLA
jgi:LAO/AO transport system kinase